ncbi:MAG: TipAS antibiotic-recognition domain-containing protein [Acidimicrobiia bacterium]|nr:TipAS antibiotic-recognition domain-containing protein [Acidimicrobiia bacterium]
MSVADFNPTEYEAEAAERWGNTAAYAESAPRTAAYTKADWERIGAEAAEISNGLAALMEAEVAPDSESEMQLAERHRRHISEWFYECPPQMHAALGEMYVADPRFSANFDKAGEGLAAYLSAAITANRRKVGDG